MPIIHRQGDLFNSTDLQAISHGVNCCGIMSAGIAVEFKRRYPEMFQAYRRACIQTLSPDLIGSIMPWEDPTNNLLVYNLFTQPSIQGRIGPANLWSIYESVKNMLDHAADKGIDTIGIPKIGAGLGGLEWNAVEATIESALVNTRSSVSLIVHSLV